MPLLVSGFSSRTVVNLARQLTNETISSQKGYRKNLNTLLELNIEVFISNPFFIVLMQQRLGYDSSGWAQPIMRILNCKDRSTLRFWESAPWGKLNSLESVHSTKVERDAPKARFVNIPTRSSHIKRPLSLSAETRVLGYLERALAGLLQTEFWETDPDWNDMVRVFLRYGADPTVQWCGQSRNY